MNDEIEVIIENKKIILVEGLSGVGKSTYIKKRIGNILDNENTIVMHGDRIRPYVKENVEQYFQENKSLLYKTLMTTVEDTMIIDGLIHTTEYESTLGNSIANKQERRSLRNERDTGWMIVGSEWFGKDNE